MDKRRKIYLLRTIYTLLLIIIVQVSSNAQPLKVVFISPNFNEIASNVQPHISATFNRPVVPSTLTKINFAVLGERSGYCNGNISYDSTQKKAIFSPTKNFIAGEQVTVSLARGICTLMGDSLTGFTWRFRIPAKSVSINFSNPVSYGGGGYGMQCIDMNNDDSPDIVTSSGPILLNNGNGQFNTSWTLPDADGSGQIAIDDFNRDGIMDVVYNGSDGIKIGLGDGTGNFTISTKPFWFSHYVTADVNNDGYPDLIGILPSDLVIALNNGAGQFVDSMHVGTTDGFFTELLTTDIDNDGDLDVAVISNHNVNPDSIYGFEGLLIFRNNGEGIFSQTDMYPAGGYFDISSGKFLCSADFNNDSFTDIAVMADFAGTILLNSGGGTFTNDSANTRTFWGAEQISPFTCGDINGDGWIDIAKSGYTIPFELYPRYYAVITNCNSNFLNCSNRNFFGDTLPNALIHANAAVDLDADGDIDLVHSGDGVFITLNRDTVTSVDDNFEQPKDFSLYQNYPNPFNGETIISFRLLEKQKTSITIYNILGQEVKKLKDEIILAGEYKIVWNGTDNYGASLPSGIYFVRLQSNKSQQLIKAVLIK